MNEPIHFISLGAGLQSSCMSLMAGLGEIKPMPTGAIFSDTGDESESTLAWLEKLRGLVPFPIHVTQRSVLSEHLFEWGQSQIPAFMQGDEGTTIGKRQCTKHWKVVPVQQKIRELTETQKQRLDPGHFVLWQGISVDELSRCKESRVAWIKHRWPLIEHRMNRQECKMWLLNHGYPIPPKSACVYCPYQCPSSWRAHKEKPDEWAKILKVDAQLAERGEFLTTHLQRIDQVDFSDDVARGQSTMNLFAEQGCEGMCGV